MYDSTTIPNPFRPGTGAYPPVLAGREAEQSMLTEELLRISHASLAGPANPLLLSAPRGMGKTVLLSWLARQAETQDVQVVAAAAGDMPDLVGFAGILWPDSRKTPSRLTSIKAGIVAADWRPPERDRSSSQLRAVLLEHLLHATAGRPTLIQIDEAHTLAPDVANAVCNLAQSLVRADNPVWIVLAGTPGLVAHLTSAQVGASFIERADVMALGGLAPPARLQALEVAAWSDWQIDRAVLELAAQDSQGFPYFLQRWGHALWESGKQERTLSSEVLAAARRRVDSVRGEFYARRYAEIYDFEDPRLVAAAQAVARALLANGGLSLDATMARIKEAIPTHADAVAARRHLERIGFIYHKGGVFVGGILSLLRYVTDNAAASA